MLKSKRLAVDKVAELTGLREHELAELLLASPSAGLGLLPQAAQIALGNFFSRDSE